MKASLGYMVRIHLSDKNHPNCRGSGVAAEPLSTVYKVLGLIPDTENQKKENSNSTVGVDLER